ncbi:unnamed protein product, partial [Scytosiphon promiscuus]
RDGGSGDAGETITLRVRPGRRARDASRISSIYSPISKEEADQEQAQWHLSYFTGPMSAGKINVTLAAFGRKSDGCAALAVVMASPEDGCSALRNAQQVEGAHVLVRRGGCSFFAKALSVSNSGGMSLVVIDEGAGRLRMEAEEQETVDISVVMVSKVHGEQLKKMATSTSRATGKVTATLVVTAACLSQGTTASRPPLQSSEASDQGERRGRRLVSPGAGVGSGGAKAVAADTAFDSLLAAADRATMLPELKAETFQKGARDQQQRATATPSVTALREVGRAALDNKTAGLGEGDEFATGASEEKIDGNLGGEKQSPRLLACRERSSGPLRGGDLIPEREGPGEGVSTHDLTVAVLAPGCDHHAKQEHEDEESRAVASAMSGASRTALFLPPDPHCSVEQQIRLGARLGAATLVVVAAGSQDEDIVPIVSSATESIFAAAAALHGGQSPHSRTPARALAEHGRGREREDSPEGWEEERRSQDDSERREEDGGGGTQQRRHNPPGGEDDPSSRAQAPACPPLTVVVGHSEGSRMLEWVLAVRDSSGVDGGGERAGAHGRGAVTARLAERDEVGRLWGDVVWAGEPSNWPRAGHQQRQRILNRLRKTHSPEHANRHGNKASRTASATRWSLLERAYAAATDGGKRGSVEAPKGSGAAGDGEE